MQEPTATLRREAALTTIDGRVIVSRVSSRAHQDIARYDFRASSGQPRPNLRTLVRMHEVLVDRLSPMLARQLRCEIDIELAAIELATFDEYVRSMPLVTVVVPLRMSPLEGRCAVELNPQLATIMVERMLGGAGTLPQLRRLTDVEVNVLEEVVEGFADGIASTFGVLLQLEPHASAMVFDPEFLDIAEGRDSVVLLAYQITLRAPEGITEGIFTVCYPTSMLSPVLRQLSDAEISDVTRDASRSAGPLATHLPEVAVPVTVRLNETMMIARDLASLQPGDVLRLDHRLQEPAVAQAGSTELFTGHLGKRRRHLALQVATVLPNGQPASTPEVQTTTSPDL